MIMPRQISWHVSISGAWYRSMSFHRERSNSSTGGLCSMVYSEASRCSSRRRGRTRSLSRP